MTDAQGAGLRESLWAAGGNEQFAVMSHNTPAGLRNITSRTNRSDFFGVC